MGKDKRKTRLNKGEGGEFIGFGAFAAPAPATGGASSAKPPSKANSSGSSTVSLSPVYMGSNAELSILFPRIGQKRDATTKAKALQELSAKCFANPDIPKKVQVEALGHFLYLYQSKLHYDQTPRVRACALEACHQAVRRLPKAWESLTKQHSQLWGMVLCARADPAADVRAAAHLVVEGWGNRPSNDASAGILTGSVAEGMWDYAQRILSYGKPIAMHEDLFQRSGGNTATGSSSSNSGGGKSGGKGSGATAAKLTDRQKEELQERYELIVGTAISGLSLYLQEIDSVTIEEKASLLPSPTEDLRYLWKHLATSQAPLRRKTYSLLSTACQKAPALLDRDKLTKLLTQNLSSEREPTNVTILLETVLTYVVSTNATKEERTAHLAQYTKPLNKLFSKGCHGANRWAPIVLPLVALLPRSSQATILTSIWQGRTYLVGVADQLEIVSAVAETATFLLLQPPSPDGLSEVLGQCWFHALHEYLTFPTPKGGPIKVALEEHLRKTLANNLKVLDSAAVAKPQSAMVLLEHWFWDEQMPKTLGITEAGTAAVVPLTTLIQRLPTRQKPQQQEHEQQQLVSAASSHFPKLWRCLFHQQLQKYQGASGLVPSEDIYLLFMAILERIPASDLFQGSNTTLEKFLMNDVLRWMVIHTSSVSDQLDESLAKFDFHVFRWCHQAAMNEDQGADASSNKWWDSILRELVAAKCDLQVLVTGLIVLTSSTTTQEATIELDGIRSPILDELCVQVAKEALKQDNDEDEDPEEISDATEIHLQYYRTVLNLAQTCVGLGRIECSLVGDEVVSKWIDLACPVDPSSKFVPDNPILEVLISLMKDNQLNDADCVHRIIQQAWRQGDELWKDAVSPWLVTQEKLISSVQVLATKELRSILRQAASEPKFNFALSENWSTRAVRLLHICDNVSQERILPQPSLEILGMEDLSAWLVGTDHQEDKMFGSHTLLKVLRRLESAETRWEIFTNSKTIEDPDHILIQLLFNLSKGSPDILLSDDARRCTDDCSILLNLLGGNAIDKALLKRWTVQAVQSLSSIVASEESSRLVCKAIAVVSQLLALNFSAVRPAAGTDDKDKIKLDQVREGDGLWYISNSENSSVREPCVVVKVHNDHPSEVYFTIRVDRDDGVQERQTVGERLRCRPSTTSTDGMKGALAVDKISASEILQRKEFIDLIMNALPEAWDETWNINSFEILHIMISRIGLLESRGLGSTHYTIFQKLMGLQTQLVEGLSTTDKIAGYAIKLLWKLAYAFGYGANVPSSQWNQKLIGFDPSPSIDALVTIFYGDNDAEIPSVDAMSAAIAWLSISLPSLQNPELLGKARSLAFFFSSKMLSQKVSSQGGFQTFDLIALRAIEMAQNAEEADTEGDAVEGIVHAFATRWEMDTAEEKSWLDFPEAFGYLEEGLEKRTRLMGIASRKHADSLAAALYVERKRWLALRLLESYAKEGKPIHNEPEDAMNDDTADKIDDWSKALIDEEAEELEEDVEIVCQWVPRILLNEMEVWHELTEEDFQLDKNDVISRLSCWLAYLRIVDVASTKDTLNRPALTSYTTKCESVPAILNLAVAFANVSNDRKVKIDKVGQLDQLRENNEQVEMSQLASLVLYRTVEVFPTLAKNWWEMSCPNYSRESMRDFVETHVSPQILSEELTRMKKTSSFGNMTVKGSVISREVTALYNQDDFTLSVVIKIPLSFPFRRAEVDCSKTLGVPENRWKRWSLQISQMLNNQGGTLKDALLLWKENVDKEFEGVEPCPVCYSVLHVKTHKLPDMQCKTCNNCFHHDCLTQWFRSSGKSACVICQQPWSGTRVQ